MKYVVFPINLIEKNSRVVLYGAGKVAQNYCKQNRVLNYCDIIFAVDKKVRGNDGCNEIVSKVLVKSVEDLYALPDSEYDYVLISVMGDNARREIYNSLKDKGISEEKIINPRDNMFDWDREYENKKEELDLIETQNGYIKLVNSKKLLDSRRMDVIVRYLVFKDWSDGIESSDNEVLFRKFLLYRNTEYGIEGTDYSSEKSSINAYVDSSKAMCKNVWTEGLKKENFISADGELRVSEGLQQIAAALVGESDVWVRNYGDKLIPLEEVGFEWFKNNGFDADDCIRILKGYTDLYEGQKGIFILYGTCQEYWDFAKKYIDNKLHVIGDVELDFSHDFLAYKRLIFEIYNDYMYSNELYARKIQMLMLAPLKIKLILVSDERNQQENFYESMRNIKLKIRETFGNLLDERTFVTMHSSDDRVEFEHMKNLLLSANGLKQLKCRVGDNYKKSFLDKLDSLKKWCCKNDINPKNICIVGSAVLEAYGLRECDDIDFILDDSSREKMGLGAEGIKLSGGLEIVKKDGFFDEKHNELLDSVILNNDNYHFYVNGFKFINLDYVYLKKNEGKREKDVLDAKLIRVFKDYVLNFDEKEQLRLQIKKELENRGYEI